MGRLLLAPGSSAIVTFIVIAIITSASVLRVSFCTEITHGKLSIHPRPPSFDSLPTTPPAAQLPPSLNVDVTLGGTDLHLDLKKDQEFKPQVPVFELYTDDRGKEQIKRARLRETEYSVYHDDEKEADFIVFREKDQNGTLQYKLQGTVRSGGLIYDLRTTGKKLNKRTEKKEARDKREAPTGNPSPEDLPFSTAKAWEEQDDGQEENLEWEFNTFSEGEADNADSLPRPLWTPKSKVMVGTTDVPRAASRVPPFSTPTSAVLPSPSPLSPNVPSPNQRSQRRWRRRITTRRKRQVTQDIYVDVVALADYGVYKTWYSRSNESTAELKKEDTLEQIRRYYSFVLNEIDRLYRDIDTLSYTIHVRLASVVVATTAASSTWTEQYKMVASPWDEVDANDALQAVSGWAATTDVLPTHDHLMVFTGYDLTKLTSTGVRSDAITGLAFTSTLCDTNGKATSIVEDLGGFQCTGTAAHELGHGLSAEHDGTFNPCRSQDRYIMAAGTHEVTSTNKLNPWKFSSCSINYFSSFCNSKVRFLRGRTCLYETLARNSSLPNVTSQMEGQLYDVDAQCRQIYGSGSRLCRGPEFGTAADVCTKMFCFDPTTTSTCYQLVAARGTTCGNGKWCESGQCVSNSLAPSADENCVFGDQPGTTFSGQDCATFVGNFPGFCYQDVVRIRCCASCAKYYQQVQDCEYGDPSSGCIQSNCPFGDQNYLQSCCGTCSYGSTFTTTTTTTTTTSTTTTTTTQTTKTSTLPSTTRITVATDVTTTSENGPTTTISTGDCVNNNSVTINMLTCAQLVASSPSHCYDTTIITLCCLSCQEAATEVAGCEYGDRRPNCATVDPSTDDCLSERSICCKTCAGFTRAAGHRVTADVTVRVIVTFFVSLAALSVFLTDGRFLCFG